MSLPTLSYAPECQGPIRVAIANDYPLVIAGIASVLEGYPEQVMVVEYASRTAVTRPVDVVMRDTFAEAPGAAATRTRSWGESSARVLIFTWDTEPQRVSTSLRAGASGVVSKTVSPAELVDALLRVHHGEQVTPSINVVNGERFWRWPGDEFGLSSRESEVLALICQGFSNQVIGHSLHIGSNTVKTYIRSLYRKIEVVTRSQAVIWGMSNGFAPQALRVYPH